MEAVDVDQARERLLHVGDVVAGKYRVERVLGEGGMGVVVAAVHLELGQLVALKYLRPEARLRPQAVDRFQREARAAVRLKSEHAARIFDVGTLDADLPYIVMEHLEGQDLAKVLRQRGALPVPIACEFIIQACDAIAEAHALGIVHRDLKPANLFLADASHGRHIIKVLDFGISKSHVCNDDVVATRTQEVLGSPGYMSPEQIRSTRAVDARTDIWSLGVVLYQLVSGRLPFQGESFTALCLQIAIEAPRPLPELPTSYPPGFDAVIRRALEKDPALRYPSAADLGRALAPYATAEARHLATRLEGAVSEPPPAEPMLTDGATTELLSGQSHAAPPRKPRWVPLGGAAIAVAALGLAIASRWSGSDRQPAPGAVVAPWDHRPELSRPAVRPTASAPAVPAMTEAAIATPPATSAPEGPGAVVLDAGLSPSEPSGSGAIEPAHAPRDSPGDARPAKEKPSRPAPAFDPFSSPD